jgi:3-dehydroquinate synthase
MLTVKSSFGDYAVQDSESLDDALSELAGGASSVFLVDSNVVRLYREEVGRLAPPARLILVEATEEQKSLEKLPPIVIECISKGLKRNGHLVVIGGGVLQDIGCFVASVLFRGIAWSFVPTTLLAQADSCIGSKSSINVGPYKNQIGTFYPPARVLMVPGTRRTLPWDEIRSGLGEIIKLQLIAGPQAYAELCADLARVTPDSGHDIISKWVGRSLSVKKAFIEEDEFDRGKRNILNYGHTFAHAFESATNYAIPHGIAVIIGILAASYLSSRIGWLAEADYRDLKKNLQDWCKPYGRNLLGLKAVDLIRVIKHDKKNTASDVNCILTKGPGLMEKRAVDVDAELFPALDAFLSREIAGSLD